MDIGATVVAVALRLRLGGIAGPVAEAVHRVTQSDQLPIGDTVAIVIAVQIAALLSVAVGVEAIVEDLCRPGVDRCVRIAHVGLIVRCHGSHIGIVTHRGGGGGRANDGLRVGAVVVFVVVHEAGGAAIAIVVDPDKVLTGGRLGRAGVDISRAYRDRAVPETGDALTGVETVANRSDVDGLAGVRAVAIGRDDDRKLVGAVPVVIGVEVADLQVVAVLVDSIADLVDGPWVDVSIAFVAVEDEEPGSADPAGPVFSSGRDPVRAIDSAVADQGLAERRCLEAGDEPVVIRIDVTFLDAVAVLVGAVTDDFGGARVSVVAEVVTIGGVLDKPEGRTRLDGGKLIAVAVEVDVFVENDAIDGVEVGDAIAIVVPSIADLVGVGMNGDVVVATVVGVVDVALGLLAAADRRENRISEAISIEVGPPGSGSESTFAVDDFVAVVVDVVADLGTAGRAQRLFVITVVVEGHVALGPTAGLHGGVGVAVSVFVEVEVPERAGVLVDLVVAVVVASVADLRVARVDVVVGVVAVRAFVDAVAVSVDGSTESIAVQVFGGRADVLGSAGVGELGAVVAVISVVGEAVVGAFAHNLGFFVGVAESVAVGVRPPLVVRRIRGTRTLHGLRSLAAVGSRVAGTAGLARVAGEFADSATVVETKIRRTDSLALEADEERTGGALGPRGAGELTTAAAGVQVGRPQALGGLQVDAGGDPVGALAADRADVVFERVHASAGVHRVGGTRHTGSELAYPGSLVAFRARLGFEITAPAAGISLDGTNRDASRALPHATAVTAISPGRSGQLLATAALVDPIVFIVADEGVESVAGEGSATAGAAKIAGSFLDISGPAAGVLLVANAADFVVRYARPCRREGSGAARVARRCAEHGAAAAGVLFAVILAGHGVVAVAHPRATLASATHRTHGLVEGVAAAARVRQRGVGAAQLITGQAGEQTVAALSAGVARPGGDAFP